ncbi:GvpL/GvpF family gas vesicle protein [Amycolatopsis sp. NPDC051758]|uniref:GvpL/GvpF family gas vesicle protein n=1 Tax=Amycolatopsis sp. NPDC051758 TaxID=3363935 RepID=UPI00378A0D56
MRLNLHGVVRAGHPLPGPARSDAARLVVWEDLALAVSPRPADRDVTPHDATQHLLTLSALVRQGPVVPLRWGTVAEDDESARTEVIRPLAHHLRAELDRLEEFVEAHVYLRFDEETALQAVADDPARWRSRGGRGLTDRIKAGEAIARDVVAWRQARADELLGPVMRYAAEVQALEEQEHLEERRALLVRREDLPVVQEVIGSIAVAGVDCRLVGPLPAFTFLRAVSKGVNDRGQESRWGW